MEKNRYLIHPMSLWGILQSAHLCGVHRKGSLRRLIILGFRKKTKTTVFVLDRPKFDI
jgi:hypothetical protein